MINIWARDVQLIGSKSFCVFKDANYFAIFAHRAAKHVSDNGGFVTAKLRKFLSNKGAHADILQTHGVKQSSGCFAQARGRCAFDWFEGKAFDDDAAQRVEIY